MGKRNWRFSHGQFSHGEKAQPGSQLKLTAWTLPVNFFWMYGNFKFDNTASVCSLSQATPATSAGYCTSSWVDGLLLAASSLSATWYLFFTLVCYVLSTFTHWRMAIVVHSPHHSKHAHRRERLLYLNRTICWTTYWSRSLILAIKDQRPR